MFYICLLFVLLLGLTFIGGLRLSVCVELLCCGLVNCSVVWDWILVFVLLFCYCIVIICSNVLIELGFCGRVRSFVTF